MKTVILAFCSVALFMGCNNNEHHNQRIPIAAVGKVTLFYDEVPGTIIGTIGKEDSASVIKNFISGWAKRQLLLRQAEDNLTAEKKDHIEKQLEETRSNLIIYEYQQEMILEKMDTVINENEIENYYMANENTFSLTSNIIKALLIKLPAETPDLDKIRTLARSNDHKDLQELEGLCYQFAEIYDDFDEDWVPLDRLTVEIHENIEDEENFLRTNTFFEKKDTASVYLVSIRDYRLRSSLAPFEYVKDDIKRIIWNNRRFEFLQSLENGIYNDALKDNSFKIY
jgi:hypothetical protein